MSFGHGEDHTLLRLIKEHSPDRLLLGSDSPWGAQDKEIQYIQVLPIEEDLKEKILYKNAERSVNPLRKAQVQ